jgi:PAS domain S-box-containing protein
MKNDSSISEKNALEAYLSDVRAKADKISDKFILLFFVVGLALAPVYQTWLFSLITGSLTVAMYLLARFGITHKGVARQIISSVYAVFVLQFIGQLHGMAESHFFFFTNISLLLLYLDWRIMIPYCVLTVSHHGILAFFQYQFAMQDLSKYFITYTEVSILQLSLHFGLVALMGFVCGLYAIILERNSIELFKAQLLAKEKTAMAQASEEEVRQNFEELQATQDLLKTINLNMEVKMNAINSTVGYMELTPRRTIDNINEKLAGWLEYEPEDIVGKLHEIVVGKESIESGEYEAFWQTLEAGKIFSQKFPRISKTGKTIWVYASYCPLFDEKGKLLKIIKLAVNITQTVEQTQQLRASEEKLQENLDYLQATQDLLHFTNRELEAKMMAIDKTVGYMELSPDRKIALINENLANWLGYTNQELNGKLHQELVGKEYANSIDYERFWQILQAGHVFSDEFVRISKTGERKYLYGSYIPLSDDHGKVQKIIKLVINITENKLAEEKLRENEQRITAQHEQMQRIFDGVPAMIYQFKMTPDGQVSCPLVSQGSRAVYGVPPEAIMEDAMVLIGAIHKDDVALFQETVQKSAQTLDIWQADVRVKIEDKLIWVRGYSKPVKLEDGSILWSGIIQEVTAIKQAETKLKAKNDILIENQHELEKTLMQLYNTQDALMLQKKSLENTLKELKNTQTQLIQSEKMASLGQLVASVAHEINTPLGAIRSSVETNTVYLQDVLENLPTFLASLNEAERDIFMTVMHEVLVSPAVDLSSRERRQIRNQLTDKLTEQGIKDAYDIADFMVELGMNFEYLEKNSLLQAEHLLQVIQMLNKIITVQRSNQNIQVAIERVSKIIFALKNFSRQDQTGDKKMASVQDSIETVLTLYQNQLKQGIEVVKNFDNLPEISCYPDELVQVWTNLIHNAIHAMTNVGTLTIASKLLDNEVQVSITDTGHGIPAEIQDKIFNAFFTTKRLGEGSGLGLDIVKKIIDKHNGKIWFESTAGKGTTFFVEIPC